jgi:hypothetical protein
MSGAVVNPFDFHQKRESFVEDVELVGTGDDEDDSFLDSAGPAAQGRPAGGAAQPSLVDSVLGNAELQRLGRLCGRYKKEVASALCMLLGLYMLVFVLQGAAAAAGDGVSNASSAPAARSDSNNSSLPPAAARAAAVAGSSSSGGSGSFASKVTASGDGSGAVAAKSLAVGSGSSSSRSGSGSAGSKRKSFCSMAGEPLNSVIPFKSKGRSYTECVVQVDHTHASCATYVDADGQLSGFSYSPR